MSTGRTPRGESELWSYISQGDGEHCPFYSDCHIRQKGGWCPDENRERLDQLEDSKQFDLKDYDFVECGACEGVFKIVEELAQGLLKKGNVHGPPAPNWLVSLVDEHNPIEIHLLPLKAFHGAIWRLKDRWIVQLNKNDPSAVRRFSLFHEAFHILAHSNTTPVFSKRGALRGSFNERLATYFSTCILIPNKWLEEKWAEVRDLDKMAELFDVPKPTMCIRLKRLGLI